ncbi:MAG TPA: hypothetical protein VMW52_01565 [Phycisphaerae bacterium]|nr:hypothetical protein [Phycisphaerae bacterium]
MAKTKTAAQAKKPRKLMDAEAKQRIGAGMVASRLLKRIEATDVEKIDQAIEQWRQKRQDLETRAMQRIRASIEKIKGRIAQLEEAKAVVLRIRGGQAPADPGDGEREREPKAAAPAPPRTDETIEAQIVELLRDEDELPAREIAKTLAAPLPQVKLVLRGSVRFHETAYGWNLTKAAKAARAAAD